MLACKGLIFWVLHKCGLLIPDLIRYLKGFNREKMEKRFSLVNDPEQRAVIKLESRHSEVKLEIYSSHSVE